MAKGAIAGFVGTMVMEQLTHFWFQHEDSEAPRRYREVTGGKYPPQRTAESVEKTLDLDLSKQQHKMLARRSQQMIGIAAGASMKRRKALHSGIPMAVAPLAGWLFSLVR